MAWLIAAHRGPTIAMVTLAGLLAAVIGAPLLPTLLAVLVGQLSVGWQNDLIDFPRDRAVNREGKPLVNGSLTAPALRIAFVSAALFVGPLSFWAFGTWGGITHCAAVLSAWSYNLYFKGSSFSVLPYLVSFTLFPATIYLAAGRSPQLLVLTIGGIAGVVIHVLNVWPDIDDDLATGVRGLPQRLVAFARESSTGSDRASQPWLTHWLRRRP